MYIYCLMKVMLMALCLMPNKYGIVFLNLQKTTTKLNLEILELTLLLN